MDGGWAGPSTPAGCPSARWPGVRAAAPGYPAEAVAFLLGDRPLRVLDLGAGTGKLTDELLAAGHEVVAVDPSAEMLAELAARHRDVTTTVGGAEQLPLPDGSVDAVVAGQAAHWFDPPRAAPELRRVLRPGGVVGFVWNVRDETVPWVRALGERLTAESRDHEADRGVVDRFRVELPADATEHESRHVQRLTPGRWSPASPPAATSPSCTTRSGRRSSTTCAPCSPSTPTPPGAPSSSCPTPPTRSA